MTKYYVYEHWRLDRDECFYVGKGTGIRAFNMWKRNKYHKAIQAKLNREGSGIEVRMVATGLTESEAHEIEMKQIIFWREAGIELANLTMGGEGQTGRVVSAETRQRISQAQIGKKRYWRNPYHQKRMVEAARTPEARAKQSLARLGKKTGPRPPHVMEALLAANLGKPAHNRRPVVCLEDGNVFASTLEAAKHYGIDRASMGMVCRKERRVAAGLRFKYLFEDA
jgi:hypothetical protein